MTSLSLSLLNTDKYSLFNAAVAILPTLIAYLVFSRWQSVRIRRKNGCEEPRRYPHKDPILGLDGFMRQNEAHKQNQVLELGQRLFKDNGNTFRMIQMGRQIIHTIEPQNLGVIFHSNSSDWGVEPLRLPFMGDFCGPGLTTTDGEAWHQSKKLFSPSFSTKAISDFSSLDKRLQKLMDQIQPGSTIDMQSEISMMFTDYTLSFLFGEDVDELSRSDLEDVYSSFNQAIGGCGLRIVLGPLRYLARTKNWLAACKRTHDFADVYVSKALEYRKNVEQGASVPRSTRPILLQSIAKQTGDKTTLRNEILNAFLVSQSTTAYLISNMLFVLSRSPETWSKLRAETFASISGDDCPQIEQLRGMRELRKVQDETLRLYPIVAANKRCALKDTILPTGGGPSGASPIYIPKGTTVSMSIYTLHRLPELWGEDAAVFNPDRWDTIDRAKRMYEYIPFGVGMRSCVGREKALAEAGYVLVRLLQRFERIESRDDRDWTGYEGLTAHNANGCPVAFFQ